MLDSCEAVSSFKTAVTAAADFGERRRLESNERRTSAEGAILVPGSLIRDTCSSSSPFLGNLRAA